MAEADAPDGRFTAYEYRYASDSDRHDLYGTSIFVQPSGGVSKPINGYLIFAGYCRNRGIVTSPSSQQIDITCESSEKDSIKTNPW